ncbi:hypothetical protein RSAG8_11157, partial [Rhizoctonia solani AG-8 WAC10335]
MRYLTKALAGYHSQCSSPECTRRNPARRLVQSDLLCIPFCRGSRDLRIAGYLFKATCLTPEIVRRPCRALEKRWLPRAGAEESS